MSSEKDIAGELQSLWNLYKKKNKTRKSEVPQHPKKSRLPKIESVLNKEIL